VLTVLGKRSLTTRYLESIGFPKTLERFEKAAARSIQSIS
jgi:hypothetical protein